jgi:hypothetical protein
MEHRGIWATVAIALATIGAGAVISIYTATLSTSNHATWWYNPFSIFGYVALVVGVLLLVSFFTGRPIAKLRTDSSPRQAAVLPAVAETQPQSAVLSSGVSGISRLAPGSWLVPPGANAPELTLRVAVAIPGTLSPLEPPIEVVTRLRGDAREDLLLQTLEQSPFTRWFNDQDAVWHWQGTPSWAVVGAGLADLTQAVLQPRWSHLSKPSILARCGLLTGLSRGTAADSGRSGAIRMALDIMINLIELDGQRRPDQTAHRTDPPPAPAALSLNEVAEMLLQLLDIGRMAESLAPQLLPPGDYGRGEIGVWLSTSGGMLGRLIDLNMFRRIPQSYDTSLSTQTSEWPIPNRPDGDANGHLVATLLEELLEQSGYRGVGQRFDSLRHPTTTDPTARDVEGEY